ncbi:MAG: hypothetical protein AAGB11_05475 [Pseudomonadota bacterium]
MNRELEKLTKWVWSNRDRIMAHARSMDTNVKPHMIRHSKNPGVDMIYNHYCGGGGVAKCPTQSRSKLNDRAARYQRLILEINSLLPSSRLKIQGNEYVSTNNASRADVIMMRFEDLSDAWFHFKKSNQVGTHRIYLNIKEAARLRAFASIARRVWDLSGFATSKVAGPGETRADTAVFYFCGRQSRDAALDLITAYVRRHPNYFNVEVPKLTQKVRGIQGVSTADEPPMKQLIEFKNNNGEIVFGERSVNQSFGSYRSHLMYMALEKTYGNCRYSLFPGSYYREFKKQVERYFMAGGINPNCPSENSVEARQKVPIKFISSAEMDKKLRDLERNLKYKRVH